MIMIAHIVWVMALGQTSYAILTKLYEWESPSYRWGNWASRRQSNLPRVLQPIGGRAVGQMSILCVSKVMPSSCLPVDSSQPFTQQTRLYSPHGNCLSAYQPWHLWHWSSRVDSTLLSPDSSWCCHHSPDLPYTLWLFQGLAPWTSVFFRVLWHSAPMTLLPRRRPCPTPFLCSWLHCVISLHTCGEDAFSQHDIPL